MPFLAILTSHFILFMAYGEFADEKYNLTLLHTSEATFIIEVVYIDPILFMENNKLSSYLILDKTI